jgi:hypothetical protein
MILKIQKFRDQTLSSDGFKAWKSSLTDLGAQFIAKKTKICRMNRVNDAEPFCCLRVLLSSEATVISFCHEDALFLSWVRFSSALFSVDLFLGWLPFVPVFEEPILLPFPHTSLAR